MSVTATSEQRPLLALVLAAACGGPQVRFDPAPAPPWIAAPATAPAAGLITAVGAAPATLDPQRDAELAAGDAKSRIGQLFQSHVVSRSSDWQLAVAGGKGGGERTVTAQSVEVRSNVKVEDVKVEAQYRDEATHTHYARVSVDRTAWTRRLEGRVEDGLREIEVRLRDAEAALGKARAAAAFAALTVGYRKGREVEPDIVVLDLLASDRRARERLLEVKAGLAGAGAKLRAAHPFVLDTNATGAARRRLADDLGAFLQTYGFVLVNEPRRGALRMRAKVGQRFVVTEHVAERAERVYAATGKLQVLDGDGSEVPALAIDLGDDRYRERDVDDDRAQAKALTLAVDTLTALFRSAFRRAYPLED